MEVVDDTLLIVACDSVITVFSLQDPLHPQKRSTISIEEHPSFIAYNGFLYVTTYLEIDREGVFEVFNITEPNSPVRLVRSKNTLPFARLRRVNNLLLVGVIQLDAVTYRIVKILPNGALEGGSFWVPPFYFEHGCIAHDSTALFLGKTGSDSYLVSIAFHEDRLPTTQWYQTTLTPDYQAEEFVASDIRSIFTCVPAKSSKTLVGYGAQAALIGSGRSDTFKIETSTVRKSHLNRGWPTHTQVVDSTAMWITGTGLYVATITQEGEIIDRGSISTRKNCLAVDGKGTRAVVLMEQEAQVLDVSDSRHPVLQGTIPIIADGIKMISETEAVTYDSVITLIDISDPYNPTIRSRHSLGRNVTINNVSWNGRMLAAACLDSGTYIMQINGMIEPLAHIPALGTDVVWKNDTLIIAEIDTLASIWDVSIAITPQLLSLLPDKALSLKSSRIARGWALGIMGNHLLVGRYNEALIFDISKISESFLLGESTVSNGITKWQIVEKLAYTFNSSESFCLHNYAKIPDMTLVKRWHMIDSIGSEAPVGSYELISTLVAPAFYINNKYLVIAGGVLGLRICSVNYTLSTMYSSGSSSSDLALCTYLKDKVIHVQYTLSSKSKVLLSVYDIIGNVVITKNFDSQDQGDHKIDMTLSNRLSNGLCWVVLQTDKESVSQALLQQQ